jgi:peptidyl-prolyl cis-trans isomerase B (cyclophilin B)
MYKFIIPLFALAFLLVSCSPKTPTTVTPPTGSGSSSSLAAAVPTGKWDGKILTGKHTVVLKTSKGDITLQLDADAAPKTVTNFITLAKNGTYNGLTFHRVIPGFMIQGGDPKGDGTGGTSIFGETFEDEINADSYGLGEKTIAESTNATDLPPDIAKMTVKEFYEKKGYTYNSALKSLPMVRGAIAMANRGPNTNGSQFFIIQAQETAWLNGQHTVFGNVTKGLDVVDAIANAPRDSSDKPNEPITYTVQVLN